jgi:transcriptional regulator with GAF, ATPase, and Fis domain
MLEAVYWFLEAAESQAEVLRALTEAGVHAAPWSRGPETRNGLFFFCEWSEALSDRIRQWGSQCATRILAVSLGSRAVPSAGAWSLLAAGASDVLHWSSDTPCAEQIRARLQHWESIDRLVLSPEIQELAAGTSRPWLSLLRQVAQAAGFTDAPILVTGESGTGKEHVARLIHRLDRSRPHKRDLVVVDCTTIVPELSGSEFFGHERGAFTGAVSARDGAFALADDGVLFLDEIGDLPLPLQAQLLRVVQEQTFKRVGGNTWQRTSFRLVTATNKDLPAAVARGEFRADLYYRIAGCVCHLPALRDRRDDVERLADCFLKKASPDRAPLALDRPVREWLRSREYSGNVRELKQLLSRIHHRHVGPGPITLGDIPEDERPMNGAWSANNWHDDLEEAVRGALAAGCDFRSIAESAKNAAIRQALQVCGDGVRAAAERLGVTDRTIQLWQKKGGANGRSHGSDEGPLPEKDPPS